MRISDWSSDVCSSDLPLHSAQTPSNTTMASSAAGSAGFGVLKPALVADQSPAQRQRRFDLERVAPFRLALAAVHAIELRRDRKSGVWGKSVSLRVYLGGLRII